MSQKRPARRGSSRAVAVSAWPLRLKVALALAIPLLLAATLGGLRVQDNLKEAANSSSSARQVSVLRPAVGYLTAAERAMVVAQADTPSESQLDTVLADVRTAATTLEQTRDTAALTAAQRYQVDVLLDLSRALRDTTGASLTAGTWVAQLRQLQSGVTQLITTIVNAQLNPEPRLELLAQTLGGRFSLAMQQALAATERAGDTGSLELFAELGAESAAIDRLAYELGDSEPAIAKLRTQNAERSRTVRVGRSDLGGGELYLEYDVLIGRLLNDLDAQLVTSANTARSNALVNGGITLGALLAAIVLALLISRSLLGPIRRVREGALAVAHEQLPDAVARIRSGADPGPIQPIDVTTHEEIGQLARAVDDLHQQAVSLAAGEAQLRSQVGEMFVTLSRRNTSLVNQQLALIETLEKDEEDPRRLESLFRLDHLAARMRRTGESLLVLADAPTQSGEAGDDLTVADALQAATAGVQDYQRVRIASIDTNTRINDSAAADVVHLLTELVDNALSYSPPSTLVSVDATWMAIGVVVEVTDAGLGIPDAALGEINETLLSGGEVTPETARRMGLFVVSRLARQHGIKVALRHNHPRGITAQVVLPRTILDGSTQSQPPVTRPEPASVVRELPQRLDVARALVEVAPDELDIEARINAVIGLRHVEPAATADSPPLPVRDRANGVSKPHQERQAEPSAELEVEPHVESDPEPTEEQRPLAPVTPLPVAADLDELSDPDPIETYARLEFDAQHTLETVHPVDALTAASYDSEDTSAGEGSEADTPIFTSLRSAWLSSGDEAAQWTSSEIEAGWQTAERVASSAETTVNSAGLPVRRPGQSLVPGGVRKPSTAATRDPETIRARLASHAAGVSRGRSAAAHPTTRQETEAGPA